MDGLRQIPLAPDAKRKAWYVTRQTDADAIITRILNELKPAQEQLFCDTETCPKPEWKHEFGNDKIVYKPGLDPYKSQVRLYQIGWRDDIYVFDLFHVRDFTKLRILLEHDDIWKWYHNGKFDYKMSLWDLDIVLCNIADMFAAGRLLNLDAANLNALCIYFLNRPLNKEQRVTDWSLPELTEEQLTYAAMDIEAMMQLRDPLVQALKQRGLWSPFSVETNAVAPTGEMELNGTKIDKATHQRGIEDALMKAGNLHNEIVWDLEPFDPQQTFEGMTPSININSHKQLLQALQRAGLDIEATNKTELKLKAIDHPITAKVLSYKKLDKLISDFGDKLNSFIHPVTYRIHSDFNALFTTTLRYSSSHPNMQNIPRCGCKKKGPDGKTVHDCARSWFVPDDGYVYTIADYAAIEMVGAAVVSGDQRLIEIFQRKLQLIAAKQRGEAVSALEERQADPHWTTGAMISGKEFLEVTKLERQNAKPANFGFLYGMSWKKFRIYAFVEYGVTFTEAEARYIRERFFSYEAYHGLSLWHQETRERYKDTPIVTTIADYQIPLEYNGEYDSFAGPAALNYQVQNPCAAGNKRGLGLLWKELRRYMHKAQRWTGPMLCRTIHDENHLETPSSMGDESCRLLERCMKNGMDKVFKRDDLVSVEAATGASWADKA